MTSLASFLGEALQPLAIIWLYSLISMIRALCRKEWKGALAFFVISLLFFVIGSTPFSARLAQRLEAPYILSGWDAVPKADAVLILGAGLVHSNVDLSGFNLKQEADRIFTAFELARQGKARALVFGGGRQKGETTQSEGEHLKMWFEKWNVAKIETLLLPDSQNTRDEALSSKSLAEREGWESIIIVTSATHMARAEAVFREVGLNVIPIACDFEAHSHLELNKGWRPFPVQTSFHLMKSYIHEVVGWTYYRYQGWISKDSRKFLL